MGRSTNETPFGINPRGLPYERIVEVAQTNPCFACNSLARCVDRQHSTQPVEAEHITRGACDIRERVAGADDLYGLTLAGGCRKDH